MDSSITVILAALASLFAVAFAIAVVALFRAKRAALGVALDCQRFKDENGKLNALLAAKEENLQSRLADKDRAYKDRLDELRNTFDATVERLRSEFSALAAEKLEEKANDLSAKNARDVKPLFDSLKQNIDDFKKVAESTKDSNLKLGGELTTKIDEVGRRAQSLGKQAEDFVTALKGGNKVQGNWGEGIVRNALENAGLKAGCDFQEQSGAKDAGLPDFTVHFGAHRKVLIDAKVNIDAFLNAVQASNEGRKDEAEALMKDHARSVRAQIAGLAKRRYPQLLKEKDSDAVAEYSPVVIMAMPSEATYSAALAADPSIVSFANEMNIVLASPQMLFGYLVLFKIGIDRLRVDRNNQEIAKRAGQIVERMDKAFMALEKIGECLKKAQEQYHESMRKLGGEDGGQNVLVPARELIRLSNASEKRSSIAMQDCGPKLVSES